ncbi:MAG: putative toxin-antitoxin system toxin component, PIN family [Candidatus Poribacteria bacterium]|nr:putative toxin-antitoxin system toxin component, PIN family [Candidatus Poribacteria bacterium]
MRRIVFDTGVLVSAFLRSGGLAGELLARCIRDDTVFCSEAILAETRSVLLERRHLRVRYGYSDDEVEEYRFYLRHVSTFVMPDEDFRAVERDPKDDVILATAVAADADYLIARDRHLLDMKQFEDIAITSPENFMAILREHA